MLRTGMHDIEVARADVGDIKPHSGVMVLFVHGKGRSEKADFVLLADVLLAVINRYLDAWGPWGGSTQSSWRSMDSVFAGIPSASHPLRLLALSFLPETAVIYTKFE